MSFHSGTGGDIPSSSNAPPDEMASPASFTHHPGKVKILPSDKDVESEEALWALYLRWCNTLNQKRDHDEMVRRFDVFKDTVRMVHRVNKAKLPYTLKVSKFADGKLEESMSPKVFDEPEYFATQAKDGRSRPLANRRKEGVLIIETGEDVPEYPQMNFKFSESGDSIIPLE
ncbi:hypothetical protein CFC21_073449 [Triticum aestivum]|uniref:Cathepsin propeptide inhibitor domain-containing protein n=2 Tax=Triticum aestivum TaxID=4565 RepID=A0A9R1HMR9_WHEAT|nr:uncharacterized protein LOC123113253 [Triticum aestivum]KAF7067576.1 hypothetical protein CFC21_073449 [Triticum aestivum]